MDTKFWGPSGWKLLHTLTFTYEPRRQKEAMKEFLETLPFILPCKFCRHSLTEYYCELPPNLTSAATLSRWLWSIHNKVNSKLRSQGQTLPPDPTYAAVKRMYEAALPNGSGPEDCKSFPGWDFLFSVAYSHPLTVKGKPMPEEARAPTACRHLTPDQEANRMNTLSPEKRLVFWNQFWTTLPKVMPPVWAAAWTGGPASGLKNRQQATRWLWRIRCDFSHGADPYRQVCQRLATYESGCSKSTRARTCRKTRKR
jgi:hypothetical protein